MSVRRSAGTIFWGLTLVTIGGLLLARNLGYPIPVWSYVARYWPALLIAWGMLKLVDYYRFRRAGDTRPLFSGGEVALLIFVIMAGSAMTTAANISPELGHIFDIGDLDLWDITGNSYNYEEHKELDVPPGSAIQIVNLYGNVDVRPSQTGRVVLDISKSVRASTRDEADRLAEDFTFDIKNEGAAGYKIVSNRDDGTASKNTQWQRRYFRSSLTILVPKESALLIDNRNGRVAVEGLTGKQVIINKYGSVDVRGITGDLQVDNRNGNVTVEDVSQTVIVNNRYSGTTANNIGGNLEIHTRNGAVDVADVKGSATISNSYAPITVRNVQGPVTVSGRNNGLDIEEVHGDLRAESSYQNVSITDARGAVTLTSRNGDLFLRFERPPQKDISVTSRYGSVSLELPSSSVFTVDARTQYGNADTEFDDLERSKSNRESFIRGKVGAGGPQITINTRNGNINIGREG